MKKILLCSFLSLLFINDFFAQDDENLLMVTLASEDISSTIIPYPGELNEGGRTVEISVNFIEDASSSWTNTAKDAFNYAVSIWEATLTSDVLIEIDARFQPLSQGVLGQAGPIDYFNFDNPGEGYIEDTYYPIALANRLAGIDLNPVIADIRVTMSSEPIWYYESDGHLESNQYDFITVALHEIAHGLGFVSSARVFTNQQGGTVGEYGRTQFGSRYPLIFDRFVASSNNLFLTDFDIDDETSEIRDFLQSEDLSWNSNSVASGTPLYAPINFDQGSSISHFDEASLSGVSSALMTPFVSLQEVIHDPGELGIAVLQDIGWDAQLVVGVEDELEIYSFNQSCWDNPDCPDSGFDLLSSNPKTEYNIGETGHYAG